MLRIMLVVEYDGTDYVGWQRQKNGVSVQGKIEDAIFSLTGERVSLVGSGRTDSGVSALSQVAHFDTESTIPPEKLYRALNVKLPPDIRITASSLASFDFHARFSAKRKTYAYRMYARETDSPLLRRFAVRVDDDVNVEGMNEAAKRFIGTFDFRCFLATNSSVKDTTRTIYESAVTRENGLIVFRITGNGFLYNMVRIMAGTLLSVGYGKFSPEEVSEIIKTGVRKRAGKTMPPNGLILEKVEYEPQNT